MNASPKLLQQGRSETAASSPAGWRGDAAGSLARVLDGGMGPGHAHVGRRSGRGVTAAARAACLAAAVLVYLRWGRQSGAHFNPAMTFTFIMLGKVRPWDAVFYALFQTAGAAAGLTSLFNCSIGFVECSVKPRGLPDLARCYSGKPI